MKIFHTILFLLIFKLCIGQTNSDSDSLKFLIRGEVKDLESRLLINGAEIKIIGTDGTEKKLITDTFGTFEYELRNQTSYRIIVHKSNYYNSIGKETTIGKYKSSIFKHSYDLQPIITIHEGFTAIDFDSTFAFKPFNLNSDTITLYSKFKNINNHEIKFRLFKDSATTYKLKNQSENKVDSINILLTDTSEVRISYNSLKSNYWVIGYSTKNRFWYNLIRKN